MYLALLSCRVTVLSLSEALGRVGSVPLFCEFKLTRGSVGLFLQLYSLLYFGAVAKPHTGDYISLERTYSLRMRSGQVLYFAWQPCDDNGVHL